MVLITTRPASALCWLVVSLSAAVGCQVNQGANPGSHGPSAAELKEVSPSDTLPHPTPTLPDTSPVDSTAVLPSVPQDLRLVLTDAGFAWRTTDPADEVPCSFCRAGTPPAMDALRTEISPEKQFCEIGMAAMEGDISLLLSSFLSSEAFPGESLTLRLASLLLPADQTRVVHGLMTHPDPVVRGRGLELAGRAQMSSFLPELSRACRESPGPVRNGARTGVHHLRGLGGETLANEFPLPEKEPGQSLTPPKNLSSICQAAAPLVVSNHSRTLSSFARGAFQAGTNSPTALPENSPSFLRFARQAGEASGRKDLDSLLRYARILRTLLEHQELCLLHPCDWLLLEDMEAAVISIKRNEADRP